ncbi:MAG: glutaredoxin family protein [Fidelibacterota bacterium]
MTKVTVYTTRWCSYCSAAKRLLTEKGVGFHEIDIERRQISRKQLARITGGFTVPQIVIGGRCIGGYEELLALVQTGKLGDLLDQESAESFSSSDVETELGIS